MRIEAVYSPETAMTTYQTTNLWQNQDTRSMNHHHYHHHHHHHHHENFPYFWEDLALNLDPNTACFGLLLETLPADVGIVPRLNHDRLTSTPFPFCYPLIIPVFDLLYSEVWSASLNKHSSHK
jgi:hypothetical protein